ncbi:MAG: plasma membrane fusion protein prm1 [Vezdaea aestivalis]|nr:MAG: plasma membrane fusion protein prm1 [Vezdaea aestivalis]
MAPLAGLRQFIQQSTQISSARNHFNHNQHSTHPSNLNETDHEMRDVYLGQQPAVPATTTPGLTPYVGLQGRLSQIWINRWTILLALVLVRLLLAVQGLDDDLVSAKKEALSACTGVESMGSAMASMPHYMSQGVNELTAAGVERAVNGLMSMVLLTVTGVEELVLFVINLLTSTYVCLITLAISGSLHVALSVIKDVSDFLNKTIGAISTDIHKDIDGFQKDLNSFLGKISGSLNNLFGGSSKPPALNIGGLDKLDKLQLPSSLNQGLDKLNGSIPNFAQVQNFTDKAIREPFEIVKKLINGSLHTFEFDRSVFPVPQKEQLHFCSDNKDINDFFQKLGDTAHFVRRVFLAVIILAMILVCIPMAYQEIRRWRTMNRRAQLFQQNAFDPVDIVHISSRPTTSTLGIKAASSFSSTRRQILTRWWVAYGTTAPALFVLSLGVAGLFACLCHYILLKSVEKEVPALAHKVGEFAGDVVRILNNASQQWAIGTNRVMESTNKDINEELFGWVNTTTRAVNDTLNTFVTEMSDGLNATFGGTVLYDPIKEVLNCLIGIKVVAVQKGLTWVSDNAHVEFPRIRNDTFSLGAVASIAADSKDAGDSFLADPSSKATDKITNAVAIVVDRIKKRIREEAIIAAFIIFVWFFLVVVGFIRAVVVSFGHDKTRAEGGPTYTGQFRSPPRSPQMAQEPVGIARSYASPTAEPAVPLAAGGGRESTPPRYSYNDEKYGWAGQRSDATVQHSRDNSRSSTHGLVSHYKR